MKKFPIIFTIASILFISCSNDLEEDLTENNKYFNLTNINSCTSRSANEEELKDEYVSGYSSVENQNNIKLLFNSELAQLTGLLADNVYITRYEKYRKIINISGWQFFEDETFEECGLRKYQNIDGSHISYNERGYKTISISSSQVILETYLIHVISDMSGNALNIYYPCNPASIKWHYYLYKD